MSTLTVAVSTTGFFIAAFLELPVLYITVGSIPSLAPEVRKEDQTGLIVTSSGAFSKCIRKRLIFAPTESGQFEYQLCQPHRKLLASLAQRVVTGTAILSALHWTR